MTCVQLMKLVFFLTARSTYSFLPVLFREIIGKTFITFWCNVLCMVIKFTFYIIMREIATLMEKY